MIELKSKWMVATSTAANGWEIVNKKSGDRLGYIEYYKPWREWVFGPQPGCYFSTACLSDLARFLEELNKEKK